VTDLRIERLKMLIRDVPDFPKPGIVFKDITPVLAAPAAFRDVIELMAEPHRRSEIDAVLGIESRGFMFGAPLALELGAAFIPVRKPGKLPRKATRVEYALEYGQDALEMHADSFEVGARILIVDDVIATGGTAAATAELATQLGGKVVGAVFLMELGFLNGRARLSDIPVISLVHY
jgi:adenine phosphoribosyltransferase